jgi:hypothetical protein
VLTTAIPGDQNDPLQSSAVTEPEPDILTESPDPSSIPADPNETLTEPSESELPTPSRFPKAGATIDHFNWWSMLGGLVVFVMAVA